MTVEGTGQQKNPGRPRQMMGMRPIPTLQKTTHDLLDIPTVAEPSKYIICHTLIKCLEQCAIDVGV